MRFGIDRFVADGGLRASCAGRRVALLGHPASLTCELEHSLDALARLPEMQMTAAFGPQHGMRGEKQDNMIESADYADPRHGIPVFSLYGATRRPTGDMLDAFDVLLVDLQDLGCRIYTFATTLLYVLEAAAETGKTVVVLDRPNPAGRPVEGFALQPGCESFVGAARMPMRHGMTLAELALWYVKEFSLDVDLQVVAMEGWDPQAGPGFGWPLGERAWVNPSPNAPTLAMARAYPGTVMLEGTTLSEGRGTTRPLEVLGAPGLAAEDLLAVMESLRPEWLAGCRLRPCFFEPMFQKHAGELCSGFQVHLDDSSYLHGEFRPFRLVSLAFKALRQQDPDYPIWRDFPYEYVEDRLAIDVINGGDGLRAWVDDPQAGPADLDGMLSVDEEAWRDERRDFLLYQAV